MKSPEEYLSGKDILIVDDDVRNTFALASYLQGIEMKIHIAENGFQAIDFLENNSAEIILMDMMMPEMDGYEAIQKIKSNPATNYIPIISVTAKAMKGDREKCLETGASEYVSKPIDLKDLLAKMVQVLNLE
jgi:two-component system chemotaxis sensor kinase CheA